MVRQGLAATGVNGVWPLLISGLYVPFGRLTLAVLVVNAAISSFALLVGQKTVKLLISRDVPWLITFVWLSSTPLLIFGSSAMREPLFWLGIGLTVLGLVYLGQANRLPGFLNFSGGVAVLLAIRPDFSTLLLYPLIALTLAHFLVRPAVFTLKKLAYFLAGVGVLGASFIPVSRFMGVNATPERAVELRRFLQRDGVNSALPPPVQNNDPITFIPVSHEIWTLLEGTFSNLLPFLFGPYWTRLGEEPILWIAALSTFHFWVLFVSSIRGVQRLPSSIPGVPILIWAILALGVFSLSLTNFGIIMRFRQAVEIMILPFAIVGLLSWGTKPSLNFWSSRTKRRLEKHNAI